MAALAMTISTRPHFSSAALTKCCTSSLRPMLHGTAIASPPSAWICATAASQASAFRPEMTTLAPCWAIPMALARPRPRLEPVTIATLPRRSNRGAVMGEILYYLQIEYTILNADIAISCRQPAPRAALTTELQQANKGPFHAESLRPPG